MARPDLIIFSQNLLGGGASFHKNMIANFPVDFFNIKVIYLDPIEGGGAKSLDVYLNPDDKIFTYGRESDWAMGNRLSKLIPYTEGAIVANLEQELIYLDIVRKQQKTVFYICHDDGFIPLALKYQSIIDVFIAHNIAVYEDLLKCLSHRKADIHFIQHGVYVPDFTKVHSGTEKLKIVFLARHHAFKGIYDLPVINELLLKKGIEVEWTILGDGPERGNLIEKVKGHSNFKFNIPKTTSDVLDILKTQDVFILPSRADGLPVALLESMSVGCVPVIANFSEGIKKVVTNEIGFVLPVGDNHSFAEKISILATDRDLLKRLSENCMQKVNREFDIKKQALEYFTLYKRYNELRKEHTIGIKDLKRIINYGKYYNRILYVIKSLKAKTGSFFNRKAVIR